MSVKIHPSAIIHSSAVLEDGVEIGPYAIVGEGVTIGNNTYVGPHTIIEYAKIGKNNHITASAFVGTPPQDLKYHGEKTQIILGDNNVIREGVSLHRGSSTGVTIIGSNCMFMAYSHVAHDCRIGNRVIVANYGGIAGHVEIGDGAFLSALMGIHQFVRIGSLAMIAGGSVVVLDVPPFCTAQGDRARLVGLNLVGLRRSNMTRETIKDIKRTYKTLYASGLRLEEAIEKLQSEQLSSEARLMVDFFSNSKRGVARPGRNKMIKKEVY